MRDQQMQELLDATLRQVEQHGWTMDALDMAAEELGDRGLGWRLFPQGVSQVIELWSNNLDQEMLNRFSQENSSEMRVRDRIMLLVKIRILLLDRHKEVARKTAKYLSLPQNVPLAHGLLYNTVNEMWYAAGDQATDFNFYSKRMLLGGVYSSTLLYWLQDHSADYTDSWKFLGNRIENIMFLGRAPSKLKDCLKDLKWRAKEIWSVMVD